VSSIDEPITKSTSENIRTIRESKSKKDIQLTGEERKVVTNRSTAPMQNVDIKPLAQAERCVDVVDKEGDLDGENNSHCKQGRSTSTMDRNKGNASKEGCNNTKPEPFLPSISHKNDGHKQREESDYGSAKNHHNTMECLVSSIDEPITKSTSENIRTIRESKSKKDIQLTGEERKVVTNRSTAPMQNVDIKPLAQAERCVDVVDKEGDLDGENNSHCKQGRSTSTMDRNKGNASKEGCNNTKPEAQKQLYTQKHGHAIQNSNYEVTSGKKIIQNRCIRKRSFGSDDQNMNCTVFFLRRGKTMSKSRIDLLSSFIRKKGGAVLERFDIQCPPTHIVVDAAISLNDLRSSLGFQILTEMATLFEKVRCLIT